MYYLLKKSTINKYILNSIYSSRLAFELYCQIDYVIYSCTYKFLSSILVNSRKLLKPHCEKHHQSEGISLQIVYICVQGAAEEASCWWQLGMLLDMELALYRPHSETGHSLTDQGHRISHWLWYAQTRLRSIYTMSNALFFCISVYFKDIIDFHCQ
jgi:hypothetical protein